MILATSKSGNSPSLPRPGSPPQWSGCSQTFGIFCLIMSTCTLKTVHFLVVTIELAGGCYTKVTFQSNLASKEPLASNNSIQRDKPPSSANLPVLCGPSACVLSYWETANSWFAGQLHGTRFCERSPVN